MNVDIGMDFGGFFLVFQSKSQCLRYMIFCIDHGKLSRHEEHIVHNAGPRGEKGVRLHSEGCQNREALLSRVQSGFQCESTAVQP